jgi:predicted metalloendopeptidase
LAASFAGTEGRDPSKDPGFAAVRSAFKAHVTRVLALAMLGDASSAQTILNLETRIAAAQWPLEIVRNKDLTYNLRSREQVIKDYPQFPWEATLKAAKLDQQIELVVLQPTAIAELAKLFRATPVSVWKDYLRYHYIASLADLMPTAVNQENFSFYGKTLRGTPAQPERWRVAVSTLNGPDGSGMLAEAVGDIYVKKHFAPQAKAQITELVHNLLNTYQERIRNSEWMSPSTREAAIRKAQKVMIKVGYPDT